jgi:hypothetical protein
VVNRTTSTGVHSSTFFVLSRKMANTGMISIFKYIELNQNVIIINIKMVTSIIIIISTCMTLPYIFFFFFILLFVVLIGWALTIVPSV